MTNSTAVDPLAGMDDVKSNWVTWGKIGDWIKGTLVAIREVENRMQGREGEMQKVYEIQAEGGSFHDIDENKKVVETPTIINAGEFWQIGGKVGIDAQLRNIKLGTIVGFRFADEIPNKVKSYNPAKQIKVRTGGADPNYNGQSSQDQEAGE